MRVTRSARLHDYQNENVISSFFLVLHSPVERKRFGMKKKVENKNRPAFEMPFSVILRNMIREVRLA